MQSDDPKPEPTPWPNPMEWVQSLWCTLVHWRYHNLIGVDLLECRLCVWRRGQQRINSDKERK